MNRYNTFFKEFYIISLYKKILYLLPKVLPAFGSLASIILVTYLFIKSFHYIMDFNDTIYCMDNHNNQGWRAIRIGTDLGTIFDVGINGGFSYGAYSGTLHFSSSSYSDSS